MLFGGTETLKRGRHVERIQVGTALYLFNMQTNTLFGPFMAESAMVYNHDPDAWGFRVAGGVKKSKFPCQVVVDMSEWEDQDRPSAVIARNSRLQRAIRGVRRLHRLALY